VKFLLLLILSVSNLVFAQGTDNEKLGAVGVGFNRNPLGAIIINNVLKDSPAFAAGVQVNDVMLSIDGKDLKGIDSLAVRNLLRGKIGSPIEITLARADSLQEYSVNIVRKSVNFSLNNTNLTTEPQTQALPTSPAKPQAVAKPTEKMAPKPLEASPPPAKVADVKAPELVYYIQTGTFFSKDVALNQIATFKKKGYASLLDESIVNGNTLFRVRIGPLSTKDSAETISKKLISQGTSNTIIEPPKSNATDSGPKK
jgi:membrane-associated protease RseP (regulator of RpoE activity)